MKSMHEDSNRAELVERIGHVTAQSRARWGRMNAEQMLAHLVASAHMAAGDLPVKAKMLPIRFFPLKQLIIYWLPFPKGAPTAPELLPSDSGSIERNREELTRLLDEFAQRPVDGAWPAHPAFGKMSGKQWGVLAFRHFDHHLRQFGV